MIRKARAVWRGSGRAGNGDLSSAPMTAETPVVFVVDDDRCARESLELLIRHAGWQPKTFASAEDFLAQPLFFAPSCLLLDVTLPGINGLNLQKRIADRTETPIIFITDDIDVPTTVRAMKAGAVDFLMKPIRTEVLLNAIRYAIDHSRAALQHEARMRALRERYASLSARERDVMALVVTGLLNKQVGGELGISEITVKAHRGNMMRKMSARSLPELVNMAAGLSIARASACIEG